MLAALFGGVVIVLSVPDGPRLPAPGGRAAPERGFYRLRDGSSTVEPGSMLVRDPDLVDLAGSDGIRVPATRIAAGPALVVFWAPACPACEADAQTIAQAEATGVLRGVAVHTIMVGTPSPDDLGTIPAATRGRLLFDPARSTLEGIGIVGAPTHLAVDGAGLVVDRHLGPIEASELGRLVRALLASPGPDGGAESPGPPG